MKILRKQLQNQRAGFTLAEVMVVIMIVATTLLASLMVLTSSMGQASHTRDIKIARELSLFKLGQFAAGLYSEDIEEHMSGDFSEQEYPQFTWEAVFGDEAFDEAEDDGEGNFNNWDSDDDDDDEELAEKPYQEVRVKVAFRGPKESHNEVIMEEWITWSFLYGEEDEDSGGN